jgi:pimeloyl-ACP methyl ester carboxylesterase
MPPVLSRHESSGLSYLRGGEGAPFLLLHGVPGSSHSWRPVGERLASRYDVIVPDLSGFGHSDALRHGLHLDHDFYLEAYAETIRGLLDDLDVGPFFLGGHDFGGAVALTLVRLFKEYTPRGLVLSATNPFPDERGPWPLRLAGLPGLGPLLVRLFAGTRLGLRLCYWAGASNKATFGADAFERHLTAAGVEQTRRVVRRSFAGAQGTDLAPVLSSLEVPTLVLWGDRDPFYGLAVAKRLVEALPDATLVVFEETGHFVPEERPDGVTWHVEDFFRARSSRSPRPVWERWSPS